MNERQKEILEILYRNGRASVTELSGVLFVSEMTVRRDLSEMEKGGFLRRYRGGAILKINTGEMPIGERLLLDQKEKEAIAAKCTAYLGDGMTVFIDSSSTCQYILPYLSQYKNITVVTNSISALLTLGKMHIFTILIGGEYYEQDMCTVGSLAERYVHELNVDVAFYTTAAISHDGVISDFDLKQTMIRKYVMKNANKNVFLFEKEKFDIVLLDPPYKTELGVFAIEKIINKACQKNPDSRYQSMKALKHDLQSAMRVDITGGKGFFKKLFGKKKENAPSLFTTPLTIAIAVGVVFMFFVELLYRLPR